MSFLFTIFSIRDILPLPEAVPRGEERGCMSKLKLRLVEFTGTTPPYPGYYWTKSDVEALGDEHTMYRIMQGDKRYVGYRTMLQSWKDGTAPWMDWVNEEPDEYIGVTWDPEPELNEFGVVSP